jgi:hypothetical protein
LVGRAAEAATELSAACDRGVQDKKTGDALHRPLSIALPRNVLVLARSRRPIGTLVSFSKGDRRHGAERREENDREISTK